MNLPIPFINQMKQMLSEEYKNFEGALHQSSPVSIRINPEKKENDFTLSDQVSWCQQAYYLESRPVFTLDPFFHAGHYYVQEASSMFIDYIFKYLKIDVNSRVLDLCSAPGGKSTLILSHLSEKGFLHCHEFDPLRAGILKQTIERWGYPNTIITSGSLSQLQKMNLQYDVILIDAPCSGEGMFRKEKDAWLQWNPNKVNHCSHLQKDILKIADSLCTQEGYIIYSTCTWNTTENEEVLKNYISTGSYEPVQIVNSFNVNEYHTTSYTYRFFPHKINGEGLSVSVMKKNKTNQIRLSNSKSIEHIKIDSSLEYRKWLNDDDNFVPVHFKNDVFTVRKDHLDIVNNICQHVHVKHFGISLGTRKGIDFNPAHGLSQSIKLKNGMEILEFDKDESIQYLKALNIPSEYKTSSKWIIATYKSAVLGWIKSGGSGLKNYFPKNLRIISF